MTDETMTSPIQMSETEGLEELRDEPLFGAFFGCDRCDGQGVIVHAGVTGRWDEYPGQNDHEEKCPDCEGYGTVWVEEGC